LLSLANFSNFCELIEFASTSKPYGLQPIIHQDIYTL